MSLARAGGLTTLFLTALVTAGLIGAEEWYSAISSGDMVKRLLVVGPLALIAITPVTFVLFPLVHAALSRGAGIQPSGKLFAFLGGVCGAIIAAWVLFRFRNALASTPSISTSRWFASAPRTRTCVIPPKEPVRDTAKPGTCRSASAT